MIPDSSKGLTVLWRKTKMNDFLEQRKKRLEEFKRNVRKKHITYKPLDIPEGLFIKCEQCGAAIYEKTLQVDHYVCPFCDYHFRMSAKARISLIADEESFTSLFDNITSLNPLGMETYEEKVKIGQTISKLNEAFYCGHAKVVGIDVAIGVLDSFFMMGSMGSAVGEKVTRLIEYATKHKLPLIIFSASGGARMQEGILSLMQMAKTSAALTMHDEERLLYISVLTNPTTGGVAASFASLGDIMIAEKSSLIGFAGARVIKQTIRQELPDGFQTDVFQLKHGQVDMIVHRNDMRKMIYNILRLHKRDVIL